MYVQREIIKILIYGLGSFFLAMLVAPAVINMMRRLKMGQPILGYLEHHEAKKGTPTMGGIIFILPVVLITLIFIRNKLAVVSAITVLSYGIIGFLDDYIKIRLKHNEGLKPYQKIIGQLGIAVIVSIFAYRNEYILSTVRIPFTATEINLGYTFPFYCIFIFIAMTNAVNLTDGLDGLVSTSGFYIFVTLTAAGMVLFVRADYGGYAIESGGFYSMATFTSVFAFALLGFFWHNSNKASIIMGDTGSLAIGGGLSCLGIFSNITLTLAMVSIVYIWSAVTVMIQVGYFKLTGKRVFRMTPYHHGLELKGYNENKIVSMYAIITTIACVVALIDIIMF